MSLGSEGERERGERLVRTGERGLGHVTVSS